jgi:hypothetical protein
MPNPNLELLEMAAERLRPTPAEIVSVGGCAIGLLIDDPPGRALNWHSFDPLMAAGGTHSWSAEQII